MLWPWPVSRDRARRVRRGQQEQGGDPGPGIRDAGEGPGGRRDLSVLGHRRARRRGRYRFSVTRPADAAPKLTLRETTWRLAICRFAADSPLPAWVLHASAEFWSITRTPHELSVVCSEDDLPPAVEQGVERDWRAFAVVGPLPFGLTGVVSGLTAPLAAAGIPVFVLSTYDTDYVLVKAVDFVNAHGILAGRFTMTR